MRAIATINPKWTCSLPAAIRFLAMLTGSAVVAGCVSVGPDYVPPQMPLPGQWQGLSAAGETPEPKPLATWWQTLKDPALNRLVEQAAADNHDVRRARSRIREARYRRLQAQASLLPALDASGSAKRASGSGETGSGEATTLYQAGFDAAWELDLFGGNRRSIEAAQADPEVQVADGNDVTVALLVPNTALRFTPPRPSNDRKRPGGLLKALMPGPPGRHSPEKKAGTSAT
jgi:hypothetical protein